jgi:hypothetical protein
VRLPRPDGPAFAQRLSDSQGQPGFANPAKGEDESEIAFAAKNRPTICTVAAKQVNSLSAPNGYRRNTLDLNTGIGPTNSFPSSRPDRK